MFILVPVVDSVIKSFMDYKIKNIISGKPGVWNNFANYLKPVSYTHLFRLEHSEIM